jgi:hypothetical protein
MLIGPAISPPHVPFLQGLPEMQTSLPGHDAAHWMVAKLVTQQTCPVGQSVKSSQRIVQISQPLFLGLHSTSPKPCSQQTWVSASQTMLSH